MSYLNTKHQRKSAVLTSVLMCALLLILFAFGMKYQDPPEEYGVAINFGTSEFGSGPPKVQESIKSAPKEEVVKEEIQKAETPKAEEIKEDVLTQNDTDAPVIPKEKPKTKVSQPVVEPKKVEEKPVVKEVPKPSKETTDALANLLNGSKSSGAVSSGEGDDKASGLKGKEDGDPTSSKYYGNGGSGGNGNYNLSGRKPLTRPVIQQNCNEEGTVVVSIEVDNKGKVIKAIAGIKGTTNAAPCLLEPAKKAAMLTKWNADGDAPSKQVGKIIYKFSLSE